MAVTRLSTDNFDTELASGKALVDFYADWCGPCKMMAPTVEDIAAESGELKVCKLNVDDAPDVASRYGVASIPTLIAFVDGKEHGRLVGVQSKDAVKRLFD